MKRNYLNDYRSLEAFIPAHLDDYGLTPYEFRMYARIARRNGSSGSWESVRNMAKACQMSEQKAKEVLRFLVLAGMIDRQGRPGLTSVYRLRPVHEWQCPENLGDIRRSASYHLDVPATEVVTQPKVSRNLGIKNTAGGSDENTQVVGAEYTQEVGVERTPKGNPMKGIQLKESNKGSIVSHADAKDAPTSAEKFEISQPTQQSISAQQEPSKTVRSKKKVPHHRREKAAPEQEPEAFEAWWKQYYEFCLSVDKSPGRRGEAAMAWDLLLESKDCLASIQEGTNYYCEMKQREFRAKNDAIGVAHGVRFLRDRRWREALDHQQSHTASKSEQIALHHDWANDPRTPSWTADIDRLGKHHFELAADRRVDPEKRAFGRWLCEAERKALKHV